MFVLVESVCTALIPAPQASLMVQFPVIAWGVASRWNYNGECMTKIFGGGAGVVTPSKPPPPMNNFRLYPPPVLRCFWKDLSMTLPPHFKHLSLLPPPHPPPLLPHKNVDHILRCGAFYGVYVSSICHVLVSIKK